MFITEEEYKIFKNGFDLFDKNYDFGSILEDQAHLYYENILENITKSERKEEGK